MSCEITLSPAVLTVLHVLERAGYPAYLVGGSLRDALRGVPPHDYDVTTPARPDEMQAVFRRAGLCTIETGLQHGTLTVLAEGEPIECTTYRVEVGYSDGRHPDAVLFTDRIADDLCRRDFTVNAMACRILAAAREDFQCDVPLTVLPGEGTELIDLYGGQRDLACGLLRCVGDPRLRFEEDSLRILRCVRFAVQLGFVIENQTARALYECRHGLARVSRERCTAELLRMMESPMPLGAGLEMVRKSELWPYLLPHCPPPTDADAARAALLPPHASLRLAQLLRETMVTGGMSAVQEACRALRLSNALTRRIGRCLLGLRTPIPSDDASLRRLMSVAEEDAESALLLGGVCALPDRAVLSLPDTTALILHLPQKMQWALERREQLRERGDCLRVSQLALDGRALSTLGLRGEAIGRAQAYLLERVLDDPALNTPDNLAACLQQALASGAL